MNSANLNSQSAVSSPGISGIYRIFPVFTISAALIYVLGIHLALNHGIAIRYYPLINEIHFSRQTGVGPGIVWFGLLVGSTLFGGIVAGLALLLPKAIIERFSVRSLMPIIVTCLVLSLIVVVLFRKFFI